ncbi:hypothetical protein FOYG_10547 [Fusarium oxysporum NRRL 32931]|uniref:Pectate lyase n=1 Tax=Fusarium oxysporum NRRL 32931 TaxID=660029 RepID=W9I066_FUSOX|nr:hypothetical protein FOYG_10547 [Fusarium oxysporum NRRL 32931]
MRLSVISALVAVGSALQAATQLSSKVGTLTTRQAKASIKTYNIADYGAKANTKTDSSMAIQKA